MSALILIERLSDGRYRASRGVNWIEWDPTQEPPSPAVRGISASPAFLRDLRDLDLGVGCANCGHLFYAHHIDGEERAPCNEFAAPNGGEGTP